jgi:predicted DNA-binding protein (MmcQ/YjbR family)
MDLKNFKEYCLSKKSATEDMPFDETTLCFRVGNKIFAITDILREPFRFNLKIQPDRSIELRESFDCITPGYYSDKKNWITIEPDGTIKDELIYELIDNSYSLVFNKLPKRIQNQIRLSDNT